MKKLIAIALIAVMVLAMTACTINDTEVSVLWSGDAAEAVTPNSLINAMDRAMYIENISYKHYAAGGDQAAQTKQAEECLDAGCSALMVELVDASAAQTIVDLAKAKNVPVVFFGCDVDAAVVNSYDKCALVTTDETRLAEAYSAMVYDYFADSLKEQKKAKEKGEEKDGLDKDGDGNITYLALTDIKIAPPSAEVYEDYGLDEELFVDFQFVPVNATLNDLTVKTEIKEKTVFFFFKSTEEYNYLTTADGKVIEAILVGDDQETLDLLVALQALGLNSTKLATHFVPVFTVGADADYKAHVMQSLPSDKDARKAYLEEVMNLVDMTTISEEEWNKWEKKEDNEIDSMIYNTMNQVDAGKLSGTAMEDYDAVAVAAAKLVSQLLQGKAVEENVVALPYTVYAG